MKLAPAACCLVAALCLGGPFSARAAVMDDFSDLNDTANPAWTHLDTYVNSTGQTWDASSGAYRMTAVNNGIGDYGFVGSYAPESFSDVLVRADVTSFINDPEQAPYRGGVFGIAARLNGSNVYEGLKGYAYVYEPFAAGGVGETVLYVVGPGIAVQDIRSNRVTLDPAKDYTVELQIVGYELRGRVFDKATGQMVAENIATAPDDPAKRFADGYSGFFAYSQAPFPEMDVTWDNFSSTVVPEPGGCAFVLIGAATLLTRRRSRSA